MAAWQSILENNILFVVAAACRYDGHSLALGLCVRAGLTDSLVVRFAGI